MNAISRRSFLAASAVSAVACAIPAFAQSLVAAPAPLAQRVTLNVGIVKVAHLAPMIGLDKVLAPLGVDLNISEFGRFADIRTAMVSGSLDAGFIGISDLPVLLGQGVTNIIGLTGVGSAPQYPTVRNGVKSDSWADLMPLKIGVPSGSATWLQFVASIVEAGLPYNKFDIVAIQGAGINYVQALQKGDVDAYVFAEPWASVPEDQGFGHRATNLDYTKSKTVGAELGIMVARKEALTDNHDAMVRFVWAYLQAESAMKADKARLTDGIAQMTGLDPDTAKRIAANLTPGGVVDAAQITLLAKFMTDMGLLTKDVSADVASVYDDSLVKSLRA